MAERTTRFAHGRVVFSISDAVNQSRRPQFRAGAAIAEDRLTDLLAGARYFDGATFSWVTGIVRLVERPDYPLIGRVDKHHGDLPITVEIAGRQLRHSSADTVGEAILGEALSALIAAGRRHERPVQPLVAALRGLGAVESVVADEPLGGDELHVRIPLDHPEFPDGATMSAMHAVADGIHDSLLAAGVGGVEGTEVGGGEFLIFCTGADWPAMLPVVRHALERLGVGEAARISVVQDGEELASASSQ